MDGFEKKEGQHYMISTKECGRSIMPPLLLANPYPLQLQLNSKMGVSDFDGSLDENKKIYRDEMLP